jgi:Mn2+/Fe2+ NRAMP family transporter
MNHYISSFASYLHGHLQEISFGMTAVVLTLAGPIINNGISKISKNLHWFITYVIFILVCTVGYALAPHYLYQFLRSWFHGLSSLILVLWIVGIYLVLAWLAKRQSNS